MREHRNSARHRTIFAGANMKEIWLRTDEGQDVIASLLECIRCVRRASSEVGAWKWAILSLHSAFQGAMVCHLSGTAQLGALKKANVVAWLAWHERDREGKIKKKVEGIDDFGILEIEQNPPGDPTDNPPEDYLESPPGLFERLYNADKRCEAGAGALIDVSLEEKDSFRRLNNLRKQFTHFAPRSWSIEISGLPRIFTDISSIIRKIYEGGWAFRHMDEAQYQQLSALLDELNRVSNMESHPFFDASE